MMDSRNGSPDSDAVAGARLVGWKAIAGHLHLGVRTAQRWEREFGLPVRRISHDRRDTVFAYVAELDAWLASSSAAKARSRRWDGEDEGGDDTAPNGESTLGEDQGPNGSVTVTPPPQAGRTGISGSQSPHGITRHWRRHLPWLVAVMALVALAVTWQMQTVGRDRGEPASVRIGANGIVALDDNGVELWSHRFPRLETEYYALPAFKSLSGVADLDGDGHVEVWFAVSGGNLSRDDLGLYLFDHDGRLRWRYHFTGSATFGDHRYSGPWAINGVHVTQHPDGGSSSALWVVSRDSAEFPSVLQRVDVTTGQATGAYWSAGWMTSVALVRADAGPRLVVGSAFNEGRAPGLSLLDARAIEGSMPAATPKYRCVDCPGKDPLALVVFPKPRRFSQLPGSGTVIVVSVDNAEATVTVQPYYAGAVISAVFRLSADLKPLHADVTDPYFLEYERLVGNGTIQPLTGPAVPPARELLPILRWENGAFVPVDVPTPASSSTSSSRK